MVFLLNKMKKKRVKICFSHILISYDAEFYLVNSSKQIIRVFFSYRREVFCLKMKNSVIGFTV